jgi:hypothetical protein
MTLYHLVSFAGTTVDISNTCTWQLNPIRTIMAGIFSSSAYNVSQNAALNEPRILLEKEIFFAVSSTRVFSFTS